MTCIIESKSKTPYHALWSSFNAGNTSSFAWLHQSRNPTKCKCVHFCCIATLAKLSKCSRLCEVWIDTSYSCFSLSIGAQVFFIDLAINLHSVHSSTDCNWMCPFAESCTAFPASPSLLFISYGTIHCGSYSVDCHLLWVLEHFQQVLFIHFTVVTVVIYQLSVWVYS